MDGYWSGNRRTGKVSYVSRDQTIFGGLKMRIIVCGGRDFTDANFVYNTLDQIHAKTPITELAHGAAKGADSLAGHWAKRNKIPCQEFPANWNEVVEVYNGGMYGKKQPVGRAAGPIRNKRMLEEFMPDKVIAFPGGSGTNNMKEISHYAGVEVIEIRKE